MNDASNRPANPALQSYFKEAGSWAADQQASQARSRKIAWAIAGVASLIALFEAIALIVLMPLKTVEPYTLLVDRQTGYVQALKPLSGEQITPDEALTRSFLAQYVIARESFDINALQNDYRKVALWSDPHVRRVYVSSMQASNPTSPLATYPRRTIVQTRIKSISPLNSNSALVRFDTIRQDQGGRGEAARQWVVIVRYRYSGQALSASDRLLNPLGFEVQHYRRDVEALEAGNRDAQQPSTQDGDNRSLAGTPSTDSMPSAR